MIELFNEHGLRYVHEREVDFGALHFLDNRAGFVQKQLDRWTNMSLHKVPTRRVPVAMPHNAMAVDDGLSVER